ncbi:MAG: hypothetical protein L6V82_01925 [Clostridiales bacterium]|nr:MAG: hypothetical protein L6V82_01925 [Clostridiales bacterium]
MQVDIYDFDKTVVPFDSALKYWGFCMVHNPWIILLLPFQFIWGMMMLTHIISVRTCKKVAFLYIRLINNEKNVKKYWDKYEIRLRLVQTRKPQTHDGAYQRKPGLPN